MPNNPWVLWLYTALLITQLLAGAAAFLLLPRWGRWMLQRIVADAMTRIFSEPYTKNLWEGWTALRKFGIQWTVENELRAHDGQPLQKPIGTHRPFPHFDGLLFSPAQLHRRALDHAMPVATETILGKRARRPMILSMPVMLTAMGYGVALSKPFARALAKGTALAKTACNAGQGPALKEFRQLAYRLVVQYHGAPWRPSDALLQQADMIEIRYGQGANAGCGTVVPHTSLTPEAARDLGLMDNQEDGYIPAGIPDVHDVHSLKRLVQRLRILSGGVPIALKLAAGNDLELDLRIAVQAGVDVVVIDGAQGGTHSAPAILVDDFGIPTLSALCRAASFFREYGLRNRIDIVISGGIRTPGDALKAIALGADAVYIGTAALFATVHTQIGKTIPFEPPTQIAWTDGEFVPQFDEDAGAQSLAKFLQAWTEEMKLGVRALGKTSVHDVCKEDLVAWDPNVARITGLPLI